MTTPKLNHQELTVWVAAMLTQLHRQNPDTEPSAHTLDRMASVADRITERFASRQAENFGR